MNSDQRKFLVYQDARTPRIIIAKDAQAAAVEGARRSSVGGLRLGVDLTVIPLDGSEQTFRAQYDPPDWSWNGEQEVVVAVSRVA